MFLHEKRERNFNVLVACFSGFFLILLISCGMWISVMSIAGVLDYMVLAPVAFTVLFSYVAGVVIRGLEKHSIGLDIDEMDCEEIEFTIMMLEKKKREFIKIIPDDKKEKK